MTDLEIPLGKRTPKYRFFEMLPALLSYITVLLPIILSLINPLLATIFIIGYMIMWFVKAVAIAYRTIQGYRILRYAQKINWLDRLHQLEDPNTSLKNIIEKDKNEWHLKQHLNNLRDARGRKLYRPSQVMNALIIPTYKEGRDVLEPTILSVLQSEYDLKTNMILVIAYEERAGESDKKLVNLLVEKYKDKFYFMTAVMHPQGLAGEIVGKGGNINFSGRFIQRYCEEKDIDVDKVLVTTLDADNRPDPSYFAYATYEYIISGDKRRNIALQPISLYLNNIWDVPAPMRVLATGNSFWTIINSQRRHLLRNFSSHSQGLGSLIDTNFWSARTIVEDGHQYWRSYFRYDGQYEVLPIYVPIYQDAVLASSYAKTMKAQFIQLRRWAYGASDVAYIGVRGFNKDRTVPFWGFLGRFLRLLDSHVSWATASIIIALGAWAPLYFSFNADRSIVAHELPLIASQLQNIALAGLFIMIFLTFKLLPPRPARYKAHRTLIMLIQWVIMPVTSICYGSAAAFTSQTHLLLGKYLDKFDVTVKAVKK